MLARRTSVHDLPTMRKKLTSVLITTLQLRASSKMEESIEDAG